MVKQMKNADYRKHNDRSLHSSSSCKKDGIPTRAILKREAEEEIEDNLDLPPTLAEQLEWDRATLRGNHEERHQRF